MGVRGVPGGAGEAVLGGGDRGHRFDARDAAGRRGDLAIRRFLGYGLSERLPSSRDGVSYAQCVRFANSSIFEQLFTQVLARCREAGLLDARRLVVDATHVEANAALKSLRAELSFAADDGQAGGPSVDAGAEDAPAGASERPALALAEPRSGPTPRRRASNATAVSRSDPDAKLRHKPGQRPHLVHRAQIATDPKARVSSPSAPSPRPGMRARRWACCASARVGPAMPSLSSRPTAATRRRPSMTNSLTTAWSPFIPPQPNMLAGGQGQARPRALQDAHGRGGRDRPDEPMARARSTSSRIATALDRARSPRHPQTPDPTPAGSDRGQPQAPARPRSRKHRRTRRQPTGGSRERRGGGHHRRATAGRRPLPRRDHRQRPEDWPPGPTSSASTKPRSPRPTAAFLTGS